MSIENPKCETCRWWKEGDCHRYPSVQFTMSTHFCGEHSELRAKWADLSSDEKSRAERSMIKEMKKYFADKVAEPVKTPSSFPIGDTALTPERFAQEAKRLKCQHEWKTGTNSMPPAIYQCCPKCGAIKP